MLKYLLFVLFVLLALAVWYRAGAAAASLILFDEGNNKRFVFGDEVFSRTQFTSDTTECRRTFHETIRSDK